MNYAHLDERGNFLQEDSYDPPLDLDAKDANGRYIVDRWDNGNPKIAPLVLVGRDPGPDESLDGFTYTFNGVSVLKDRKLRKLSGAEIKAKQNSEIRDRRIGSLPTYDDVVELLSRVLIGVVQKQAMMENPNDPRTKNLVTPEDLSKLQNLLAICEANVLVP